MVEENGQLRNVAVVMGIVAAAMLVVAFFLPYASAVDDYRETLGSISDNPYSEIVGMSNGDIADLSLAEYVRIYSAAEELGMPELFATIYVPVMVAPVALSALCLLFSALRKPVPMIVFSALIVATILLLSWDFEDRGVIPSSNYDWGVAKWVYLLAGIAVVACAVWQIVLRRQSKKAQVA